MSDAWIATYKITLRSMCEHDEPNAEDIVKCILDSEGIFGCADMDDCELVLLEKLED
jgi:hypothetical protein